MALSSSSYDTPLILQSAPSHDQQDLYPTKSPAFLRDAESQAKVVVLHRVAGGNVVIQSADDKQELIVGANGGCFFESPLLGISEEFKVESIANGSMVFVSCRTGNALDCDEKGFPQCIDTILRGWFLLTHEDTTIPLNNSVVQAVALQNPVCERCNDIEAKERREHIMQLVSLGKSLDEIDEILLRMYAWSSDATQDSVVAKDAQL